MLHKKAVESQLLKHLTATLKIVIQRGHVLKIVLASTAIGIGVLIMTQLDQIWMVALSLPIILYGPLNAALLVSDGAGSLVAGRIQDSRFKILLAGALVFAASLLLLVESIALVVIGQILFIGGFAALSIIVNRYLHQASPSNLRGGVSSLVSTTGILLFLPIAYIFGFISELYGVFTAAWLAVMIAVISVAFVYSVLRVKIPGHS